MPTFVSLPRANWGREAGFSNPETHSELETRTLLKFIGSFVATFSSPQSHMRRLAKTGTFSESVSTTSVTA